MTDDIHFHNCYLNLYKELMKGKIRNNDDALILAYECAIRKVYKELNTIFPYNAKILTSAQINSCEIQKITNAGLDVLLENYLDDYTSESEPTSIKNTYLFLNGLDLDYPFLESQRLDIYPDFIAMYYSEQESQDNEILNNRYSQLNLRRMQTKKKLSNIDKLGWTNDYSQDFKQFLKLFPDVLEASSKNKRCSNIEKIVNMFFVYDRITFFNDAYKDIIELPYDDSKIKSDRTLENWVKKIKEAIDTYDDYYYPFMKN